MDEIAVLNKKVDSLTQKVIELESTRPFLQEVVERNIASNEKLGETLHEVQLSMAHMNDKMDAQSKAFSELKKEMGEANKKTNDKIASLDKRVRVFHKANRGLVLARQFGIEKATGKYFVFVDYP